MRKQVVWVPSRFEKPPKAYGCLTGCLCYPPRALYTINTTRKAPEDCCNKNDLNSCHRVCWTCMNIGEEESEESNQKYKNDLKLHFNDSYAE